MTTSGQSPGPCSYNSYSQLDWLTWEAWREGSQLSRKACLFQCSQHPVGMWTQWYSLGLGAWGRQLVCGAGVQAGDPDDRPDM